VRSKISHYIWEYNACDRDAKRSHWHHFLQIVAMVAQDLFGGMLTLRAMGLVYTTLLAIVPLLAVSITVMKIFGVHDQLEPTMIRLLSPLGEQSVEISATIVGFVENMQIGLLGTIGLLFLIFTAISLIYKIESAFNHTWRLQPSRNLMQRFSGYLSVILIGPLLVFSAVGITASLGSNEIVNALNGLPYMNDLIRLAGKILPYVLVIAAFTFVYLLVPNTRVQTLSAFYGALIAGVLWESSSILFTAFVGGSTQYTAIYSGFAIMLTFMIWLYLSWLILLVGASIAYYHQNPERLKWRISNMHLSARMREQVVLQVMVSIAQAHDQQSRMKTSLEELARYQQVPVEILSRMLSALETDGLVLKSSDQPPQYLPGYSIQRIRLADILRSSRDAEDKSQTDSFRSDAPVAALLEKIDQDYESHLGDETLAQFLQTYRSDSIDENSLV
jgi:membrane protein